MSFDESFLKIDSLNIHFDKFCLDNVSLSCRKGEYHILMGPSGSGKSMLMKCILGLNRIQSGRIFLDKKDITNNLPEHRCMGYVPQNYALFPHLNVEENLRFAFHSQKMPVSEINLFVNKICGILKIEKLRKRNVKHLSGGEMQKVALGRALGSRPRLILLDEPFSSIDEGGKKNLWFEFKQIVEEIGITTIHITHNLEEAYTLGENLSVLIGGRLVQSGHKKEIFEKPENESVAEYLNYINVFDGVVRNLNGRTSIDLGYFSVVAGRELPEGKKVKVCIRQQDLKIVREDTPLKDSLKRNVFPGIITELFPLPEFCIMRFKMENSNKKYDLELKFPLHIKERHDLFPGKKVRVAIWEPTIIVF